MSAFMSTTSSRVAPPSWPSGRGSTPQHKPRDAYLQNVPEHLYRWEREEEGVEKTYGNFDIAMDQHENDAGTMCNSIGHHVPTQWDLSIQDTLNEGHLSNEDTSCSPNHV